MDPQPDPGASGASENTGASRTSGSAGQTALVAFSSPDEFLAELRDRGPNVDGVLRLTFRWHPDAAGAPVTDLWVVANYLRRLDPATLAVVRLDHYVGGVWQGIDDRASELNRKRAEHVRTRIGEEAQRLGIEVRAGTHTGAPSAPTPSDERP